MEGQQESEAADANRRWTCEACGCNTNSVENNPSSCSICGSSRQSESHAAKFLFEVETVVQHTLVSEWGVATSLSSKEKVPSVDDRVDQSTVYLLTFSA